MPKTALSWPTWYYDLLRRVGDPYKGLGLDSEEYLAKLGVSHKDALDQYTKGYSTADYIESRTVLEEFAKPNPMRHTSDVTGMSAHDLAKELEQIRVDFQCGLASTVRETRTQREKDIRDELGRRNNLTTEALEREERARRPTDTRPLIRDVKVETRLTTAEVVERIDAWREAAHVGRLGSLNVRDAGELVQRIHSECEAWFEIIDD